MYLIRRNSVYQIRYFDELENRQKQISTKCKGKREALQFLSNLREQLKEKKKPKFISISSFGKEYLERLGITNHSPKYIDTSKKTFKKLLAELGDLPLTKLKKDILEKFLLQSFNNAKHSAWNHYRILKASLNFALNRNYIEVNPLCKFKLPKIPEKINLYISETEFSSIIDKTESQILKDVFLFAYNSGVRLSELTNLKWSSISFSDGIIKVESDESFTTKSKRSRIIPINSILFDVLQRQLPKVMDISRGIYVFTKNGVKFNNDFVSKQFKKSVISANLNNGYHFHVLRGSFITNLAKRNVPLSAIQKLVGHENIRITEKHYLSVQNETLIQAMRTLDNGLLNKAKGE